MDDGPVIFFALVIVVILVAFGMLMGYSLSPGPMRVADTCEWQGYYNVNETRVIHCESMKK